MTTIKNTVLTLCALYAAVMVTGCGNSAPSNQTGSATTTKVTTGSGGGTTTTLSITPSVTFGQPQMGGGSCVGKGLCKTYATPAAASADAIPVKMEVSSDKKTLTLTFSKAALTSKQPAQVPFFSDPSGKYNFDAPYKLTDPIYTPLGLLPNPRIDAASTSTVTISGDVITDVIGYSHD
jgi:hypothetical protein